MLGSTAPVVLALLLSVPQTGLGEAAPAVQASADESARDGVRTEWETRAHALGRLADLIGPLRAVEAPAWEPTTSLRSLAWIDAASRSARLRGGVPAVPEAVRSELPPLHAALALSAVEFESAAEARAVLSTALRSEYSTVRDAAVERAARALFEWPALRAMRLSAPADGKDREATERLAGARAAAGWLEGRLGVLLDLDRRLGRTFEDTLALRFEHLIRAPIGRDLQEAYLLWPGPEVGVGDFAGMVERRNGQLLIDRLDLVARARDGVGLEHGGRREQRRASPGPFLQSPPPSIGDEPFFRALEDVRTPEGAAYIRAGAESALLLVRRRLSTGGSNAVENGTDVVWRIARVCPPAWVLSVADELDEPTVRQAVLRGVRERDGPVPPRALAPWIFDRPPGPDRAAALELAADRFAFEGQDELGALLVRWLGLGDAWGEPRREESLGVFRTLGRNVRGPETAEALRGAYERAPAGLRDELLRALSPSEALAPFADVLAAELADPPDVGPAPNAIELSAALLENDAVRAAFLGAWGRAADALGAALDAREDVDRADGRATRLAGALLDWAGGPSRAVESGFGAANEVIETVLPRVARLERAAMESGIELELGVESFELLARAGSAGLSPNAALTHTALLEERFPEELRVRAAEVLLWRGAEYGASWSAVAVVRDKVENDVFLDPGRAQELLAAVAHKNDAAAGDLARTVLSGPEPFLFPVAAAYAARFPGADAPDALLDAVEPALADPLAGEVALERARAALRMLGAEVVRLAAAELEGDGAAAEDATARRLDALDRASRAAPASATSDERYARTLLASAALDALATASVALGERADALLDRAFAATRVRAVETTIASLEGSEARYPARDPAPAVFARLDAGAQRRLLARNPDVLTRADARLLVALGEAAKAHDVALALFAAADVAHAGARRGRNAAQIEARALVGLLAAAEAILDEDDGVSNVSHAAAEALALRTLSTLLGRMRTGSLSSRVVAQVLNDPDVADGIDAELWVANAAWKLRDPQEGLALQVARAFARVDPERASEEAARDPGPR
ncbi:MAG: hypothetical protein AAFU73_14560 [Planctomycetota bacterium]